MTEKEEFLELFRAVQPKFSRFYASILTTADLTLPQYALLNQLANLGEVPMTEISSELHVSKPAVTHVVDRLEQKKFLKRLRHPKDRRVYLLQIQSKGKQVVRKIQDQVLHFMLKTIDQLKREEKRSVIRFYALLSQTIDETLSKLEP